MKINAQTKIAAVLKQHPGALEAIVSLNPKFEKLRNPLLRRVMAPRTSLATAAKMGECSLSELLNILKPLGFIVDETNGSLNDEKIKQAPEFMMDIDDKQVEVFDVRPLIASGNDPLKLIISKIKSLPVEGILKIINSFEPIPLISLLEKQGFQSHVVMLNAQLYETYFFKQSAKMQTESNVQKNNWEEVLHHYENNLVKIDVRDMVMPQPMHTILGELDVLKPDKALYVYHKRIPVFLLPELKERGFDYRIKEISGEEYHLLIFKN